jgi:hypothetical protein
MICEVEVTQSVREAGDKSGREDPVQLKHCRTQAKTRLEWATGPSRLKISRKLSRLTLTATSQLFDAGNNSALSD